MPGSAGYEYWAKITNVVDADTFDADVDLGFYVTVHMRFRLNAYDAPETWRPVNEAERTHGEAAKAHAVNLLLGNKMKVRTYKPGKYGRWTCDVILPTGKDYGEHMIESGFAKRENY